MSKQETHSTGRSSGGGVLYTGTRAGARGGLCARVVGCARAETADVRASYRGDVDSVRVDCQTLRLDARAPARRRRSKMEIRNLPEGLDEHRIGIDRVHIIAGHGL